MLSLGKLYDKTWITCINIYWISKLTACCCECNFRAYEIFIFFCRWRHDGDRCAGNWCFVRAIEYSRAISPPRSQPRLSLSPAFFSPSLSSKLHPSSFPSLCLKKKKTISTFLDLLQFGLSGPHVLDSSPGFLLTRIEDSTASRFQV